MSLAMCCPVDECRLCEMRSFLGLIARTDGFSCLSGVFSKILKNNVADRCTLQTMTKIQKFPGDYVVISAPLLRYHSAKDGFHTCRSQQSIVYGDIVLG